MSERYFLVCPMMEPLRKALLRKTLSDLSLLYEESNVVDLIDQIDLDEFLQIKEQTFVSDSLNSRKN